MYHIRWQYHWLKARLLALLPAMLVCTALAGLTGSLARADELNNFQDTSVQVTPHGLNALNKSWYWNLNISGYGYGTNIQPIATPATVVDGNRTEYRRGNLTEWYVEDERGVEQGFTLQSKSPFCNATPLRVEMALNTNLVPNLSQDQQAIVFKDKYGNTALNYDKLHVFDANNQKMPAHFAMVDPATIAIVVDDTQAVYPLTIDPMVATEKAILNRINALANDAFGQTVAVDGDMAVVGASGEGNAYVFQKINGSWVQTAILTAGTGSFGSSVSISGNIIVVGAYQKDLYTGAAYVFERIDGNWSSPFELMAENPQPDSNFGYSVSVRKDIIEGDIIVIGVPKDNLKGKNSGAAYIFERSGKEWQQTKQLIGDDTNTEDRFGSAISIDGNTVVIGAPDDKKNAEDSADGSVYIFVKNSNDGWDQQKLIANDSDNDSGKFGDAVSISDDTVVVGARFDDNNGIGSGAAYVFVRNGTKWTKQEKLTAGSFAVKDDYFGISVSISEDTLIVGALKHDIDENIDAGAAYVFKRSGTNWSLPTELQPNPVTAAGEFGGVVSISDDTIFVCAPKDDTEGNNAGSLYLFKYDGSSWQQTAKKTANNVNSDEQFGLSLSASGNTIVVGTPKTEYKKGDFAGSAYVFTNSGNNNWSQQAKLIPNTIGDELFGTSVSIDGDVIAVGAPSVKNGGDMTIGIPPFSTQIDKMGVVYVFRRSNGVWSQEQLLSVNEPLGFGIGVSISGQTIAVAGLTISGLSARLTIYVFEYSNNSWQQVATLTHSSIPLISLSVLLQSDPLRNFLENGGFSISIDGNIIVMGVDIPGDNKPGAAYIFERSGSNWSSGQVLDAGNITAGDDGFGSAISISGNTIAIGAKSADSVYMFERSGDVWSLQPVIKGTSGDKFGSAVSFNGDTLVVGAYLNDNKLQGNNSGAAYLFERTLNVWVEQGKFMASNGTVDDEFGTTVALTGNTIAVGVPNRDDAEKDTGAVYVFELEDKNDAPVLDPTGDMSLTTINEDVADTKNTGDLVSSIIASAGGDRITDDFGVEGIAIVAADNRNGKWQYSANGGSNWMDFGNPTYNASLLLDDNTYIRFEPNRNFDGEATINFRAWDHTDRNSNGSTADTTINGGSTAFSSTTAIAKIIVNADPAITPHVTDKTVIFEEDLRFIVNAEHPSSKALTFTLTDAPPGASINPTTGEFTWEPAKTGTYNITVTVTEAKGRWVTETFTIDVQPAKTGFRLDLDTSSIFKDSGTVTVSGKLTAYPDIDRNLQDFDIQVEIISPNGNSLTKSVKIPTTSGKFMLENLTGFDQEGVYTIQASFNGTGNLAAPKFLPTEYLQVSALAGHAIIIQGRVTGDEDGEKAHNKSLNRVYRRMKARGFVDENIEYLNYNNDHGIEVDGIPSKEEIAKAFARTQARINADPGPLYIVMVDHGGVDGSFYIDDEIVSPSDLNGWLENLETGLTSPALQKERIVIIGACYSGSYIPIVSKPGRIIVTSTTETEESYKGPTEPDKVRSGEFFIEALFSELGKGKSLQKSFNIATESVEILTRIGGNAPFNLRFQDWAAQHPLLDDNGDGKGSNILSTIWEKNQEGDKAKTTYLGLGKRFRVGDPDNPAVIIKVTPTHYLKGSQTSAQLLATINNPERVANQEVIVDIRAPSVTLSSDGTEQKGQLEINGLQRMVLKLSEANKFTGNFAGFTEPGKYEIFYFVQDTITGEVSPLKRSVVFKDSGDNNQPPYSFDLRYPDDGAEMPTVVTFDWDKALDPNNDHITYTLILASDPQFSHEVYRQEMLYLSMGYVDNNTIINAGTTEERTGLRDGTEYFWKVEAVDNFGNVTRSTSTFAAFTTNNKNQPPNINSVSIVSEFDSPLAIPRKIDEDEAIDEYEALVEACDDFLCYYFLTDGREINIPALDLTIPPNHSSETAHHHRRRGNIPSNPGQLQFAVGSIQVDENKGKVEFLVERVGGSDGTVSVSYATLDNTATKGTDYDFANDTGVLTWADKETHSQRLSLSITDDKYFEGDELFTVILLNTSGKNSLGTNSQVTVIIVDDEIAGKNPPQPSSSKQPQICGTTKGGNDVQPLPPITPLPTCVCNSGDNDPAISTATPPLSAGTLQFSRVLYSADEGQKVVITVNREDGSHGEISVRYQTSDNTALANSDYTHTKGELSWGDGDTSPKTFTVPITNDANKERDEIVSLELLDSQGNVINIGRTQAIINILDDDIDSETVAIVGDEPKDNIINGSGDNPSSAGGNESSPVITVDEPSSLSGQLPNCESINGSNGVQSVPPITTCDCDNPPVPTNVCKYDNPPVSIVEFADMTYHVQENQGYVEISVNRDNGSHGEISVRYRTSDNTALANNDYRRSQGIVSWLDGENEPKTFTVPIINDNYEEGDEIINLELLDSHGNAITIGRSQAIINILDDDNLNDDTPVAQEELPVDNIGDDEEDEIVQCEIPPELPSCTVSEEDDRTFIAFEDHSGNKIDISYVSNDPFATFTISGSEDLPILPSLGKSAIIDNGEFFDSDTKFAGGIAVDGDDYKADVTMSVSEPVVIIGEITPLPYHIGETVDILVVAGYKPHDIEAVETFYMLNTGRIPLLWDVNDIDALHPFVKEVTLKPNHRVDIFSGDFPGTAELRVFFGYRLADGQIVFNGEQTIDVIVND